jgi:hypothetical protein
MGKQRWSLFSSVPFNVFQHKKTLDFSTRFEPTQSKLQNHQEMNWKDSPTKNSPFSMKTTLLANFISANKKIITGIQEMKLAILKSPAGICGYPSAPKL